MTEAERRKLTNDWISTRPPNVQVVAKQYMPDTCYKMKGNSGHYRIERYREMDDGSVKVCLAHLHDSYGNNGIICVVVQDVNPDELLPCDCVKNAA